MGVGTGSRLETMRPPEVRMHLLLGTELERRTVCTLFNAPASLLAHLLIESKKHLVHGCFHKTVHTARHLQMFVD